MQQVTTGSHARVERGLRQALREERLELSYQPVVFLPSGRTAGFEALCRWHDDELGDVPPEVFVQVAEDTGLIHELGRQVLRAACRTAAGWAEDDGRLPSVSVNVSPLQLTDPGFADEVRAALTESGLDPARIFLEITETAAVEDLDETATRLQGLHRLGVKLALDDFGVGHSPLGMLRRLPFDVLKIDRSFVAHVHDQARDTVIIRLVIDTAHSLGLHVCAEGVESQEQAQQLLALGCDWAQGFWFGRPGGVPATEPATRLDPQTPPPVRIWGTGDELVVITDTARRITYVSPSALAMLGYSPSQLIGDALVDHIHPDDRQGLPRGDDPTFWLVPSRRVLRVRRRDGEWRWLSTVAQAVRGPDGVAQEIVSISRDVTRQVEVERRLAGSEARFEWAFEQAPIGMAISRFDGVIVQTNAAFADLLGTTPDALVGRTVEEITDPADRARDEANLRRLLRGEVRSQRVLKRYLDVHGNPVPALVLAGTLDDEEGRPALVTAHILPDGEDGAAPPTSPG